MRPRPRDAFRTEGEVLVIQGEVGVWRTGARLVSRCVLDETQCEQAKDESRRGKLQDWVDVSSTVPIVRK